MNTLSEMTGLNISTVSRRHDATIRKLAENEVLQKLTAWVYEDYCQRNI